MEPSTVMQGLVNYWDSTVLFIAPQYHIVLNKTEMQRGKNRSLVECARTMIHAKDLPTKLWAEAVNTAAYIINRIGPTPSVGKTPYELFHGRRASINHIRVFDTECFVYVPKQKRKNGTNNLSKDVLWAIAATMMVTAYGYLRYKISLSVGMLLLKRSNCFRQ